MWDPRQLPDPPTPPNAKIGVFFPGKNDNALVSAGSLTKVVFSTNSNGFSGVSLIQTETNESILVITTIVFPFSPISS